jgi:hypothetical protein
LIGHDTLRVILRFPAGSGSPMWGSRVRRPSGTTSPSRRIAAKLFRSFALAFRYGCRYHSPRS